MFLDKGLHKDSQKIYQPDGTWLDATNLVYDKSKSALSPEKGFERIDYDSFNSNHTIIGQLSLGEEVLLFFYDSNNVHKIAILDINKSIIIIKQGSNLNFNIDYPVIAKRLNDNIIVFTDNINPIRYLNLSDKSNLTFDPKLGDLIAPKFDNFTNVTLTVKDGGSLLEGIYSVAFRYVNKDGVKTNYFTGNVSKNNYIYITDFKFEDSNIKEANSNLQPTSKSISVFIGSIDISYQFLEVILIGNINNQIEAKKVLTYNITSLTSTGRPLNINSFEGDTVTLEELLINKRNLRINDLEVLNDTLYCLGSKELDEVNYQKYANNIIVEPIVEEEFLNKNNINDTLTFMPGELVALYIAPIYKDGSEGKAFHIPGRAPVTGETSASTIAGLTSYKKYQVEDTSYNVNATTNMGYWENENENYPSSDDYNSTDVGGLNLREQRVRHHKIPSFYKINNEIGSSSSGISQLIKIKLQLSNIIIPSEFEDIIVGFKIYQAKRDIKDSLVLGFSPILHGGKMANPSSKFTDQFVSIPSNLAQGAANATTDIQIVPNTDILKIPSFDLILKKPNINPVFVATEVLCDISLDTEYVDQILPDSSNQSGRILIDTTKQRFTFNNHLNGSGIKITTPTLKPVTKYKYIPENSIFGDIYNRYGEESLLLYGDFATITGATVSYPILDNNSTIIEKTGLISIRQVPKNPYSIFYNNSNLKTLAVTYGLVAVTVEGDAFMTIDTVINTGGTQGNADGYHVDIDGDATGFGGKAVRVFPTYSYNNPLLQQSDPTLKNGDNYFINTNASNICENHDATAQKILKINPSFILEAELNNAITFNSYEQFETYFPNRIYKFTPSDREFKNKITISLLPNNFYELSVEKGKANSITKYKEKLIIGCQQGCFVTRGKQSLQLNDTDAFIGNNDIFDIDPILIVDSDGNYFGNQNKFSILSTGQGVFIMDELQGKLFSYSDGSLVEISKIGLFNYFRDNFKYQEGRYTVLSYEIGTGLTVINHEGNYLIQIAKATYLNVNKFLFNIQNYLSLEYYNGGLASGLIAKIIDVTEDSLNVYIKTDLKFTITPSVNLSKLYVYSTIDSPYNNDSIILEEDIYNNRILITRNKKFQLSDPTKYKGIYQNIAGEPNSFIGSLDSEDIIRKGSGFVNNIGTAINLTELKKITLSFNLDRRFWVSEHNYYPRMYFKTNTNLFSIVDNQIWKHNVNNICNFYTGIFITTFTIIINKNPQTIKKFKELIWNIPFYLNDVYNKNKTFNSIELNNNDVISFNDKTLTNYSDLLNQGNVRNVHDYWHFNNIRNGNNRMFGQYLQVKFNFSNIPEGNDQYIFYIYEIMCKFNHVKI